MGYTDDSPEELEELLELEEELELDELLELEEELESPVDSNLNCWHASPL